MSETSPISDENWINQIEDQRRSLSSYISKRFFYHRYERGYRSTKVLRWDYYCADGGQYIKCFPVRIANIPGSETPIPILLAVLETSGVQDFVAISIYSEADTSTTINVGLRYPEDALMVWSTIHGIQCGDRLLEVYPVKAVLGGSAVTSRPFSRTRGYFERMQVVAAVISREQRYAEEVRLTALIENARDIADQLSKHQRQTSQKPGQGTSSSAVSSGTQYASWETSRTSSYGNTSALNLSTHPNPPSFTSWGFSLLADTKPNSRNSENAVDVQLLAPKDKQQPPKKRKNRTTRRAGKNRPANADDDPENAEDLNADERHDLQRTWNQLAKELTTCWKGLELPPLKLTKGDEGMSGMFIRLCMWQQECQRLMVKKREADPQEYDYSPFEDAFACFGALHSVYGRDYKILLRIKKELEQQKQ